MQATLKNRTIFCQDNLEVLGGINSKSIDLIYLDPPFNKKRTFHAPRGTAAEGANFQDVFKEGDIKEEWLGLIADKEPKLAAYLQGIKAIGPISNFAYLVYMGVRILELYRVLKDTGSLYLHCDPAMSHYLKILLDCIFEEANFSNEIVWRIGWVSGYKTQKVGWIRNHDIILYYVKNKSGYIFNKEYIPYTKDYKRRDGSLPTGKGIPIEDTWNCHQADVLDSIMIKSFAKEKTGYPTQKNLALLERIIQASSNQGDLVLDPFCGCATTCIAAERLARQWVGIDISEKSFGLVKQRIQKEIAEHPFQGNAIFRTDIPQRTDNKQQLS